MLCFACSLQARTVAHRTGLNFIVVFTGALRGNQRCNDVPGQGGALTEPSGPLVSGLLSRNKGDTGRVFTFSAHGEGSAHVASNRARMVERIHAAAKERHMVR